MGRCSLHFLSASRAAGCIFAFCWMEFAMAILVPTGYTLATSTEWGQQVVSIRLESDAHLSVGDFAGQIMQKVGQPLDQGKVTETVKRLYATGRFLELRADVVPREHGVELVFVARVVFFCGVVGVEGVPKSLDPKLLTDASRLRLGQALSEDDLAEASRRLSAVLADNGYYQAGVKHQLILDSDTEEADVLFSIAPGLPARLKQVEFEGNTLVPPDSLADLAGWQPGKHLTAARIERGLLKIHRFYVARGRLQATENVQKRAYDPRSNTETLRVQIQAGSLIRVRLAGASLSNSKMKELLPLFRDGVIDEDALSLGGQALEDYFQRRGYLRVSAKAKRVDRSDHQQIDITYGVILGELGEFEGYSFRGNRSVSASDLEAAIAEESNGSASGQRTFSQKL